MCLLCCSCVSALLHTAILKKLIGKCISISTKHITWIHRAILDFLKAIMTYTHIHSLLINLNSHIDVCFVITTLLTLHLSFLLIFFMIAFLFKLLFDFDYI